jgi:carboxyl-terminal processing protease
VDDQTDPHGSFQPMSMPLTLEPVSAGPPHGRRLGGQVRMAMAMIAILAGATLFLGGFQLGQRTATNPGTPVGEDQAFQPFWDAYDAIKNRYAGGEIDQRKLIEGAIKGMFEALDDPYSSYLTSEEYKATLQGISGEFEGIGAEIDTKRVDGSTEDCATLSATCRLVVVAPIDGSPAQKAGVEAGDFVVAADGNTLDGLTVDEARDRIRGPKGTQIRLTILRGTDAPIDITITRDVIHQKEVVTREYGDGDVSYVRLTGFSENAAKELKTQLTTFIDGGGRKIILDLRANPGGFVTAARSVASQFIGSGPIFWQEDAQGKQVETDAEEGGVATNAAVEVIVLIDRGSASASEIVAGALQDTERATVVGETSFGKGTVQQWTPLEDDAGGFRLTVAKWLTPEKHWIHNVGIAPDVPVTIPEDIEAGEDPILDKALELFGETAAAFQPAA